MRQRAILPSTPGAAPQGLKDCGSLVAAATTHRGEEQQKHHHQSQEELPPRGATSTSASGLQPPGGEGRSIDKMPLPVSSCAFLRKQEQRPEQQPLQVALEDSDGSWKQHFPGASRFAAEPEGSIADCLNGASVSSATAGGSAAPGYDVEFCKREEQQLGHLDEDLYYFGEEKSPIETRGEEATPVVAWGRCVSSDGWRRSSSGCSDDISSVGGNSEQAGASIDSACNNWALLLAEEKTDTTVPVPDFWIKEAVRYMDLVVEASSGSSTETSPHSTATCANRRILRAPSATIHHSSQQIVPALTPREVEGACRPRFKTAAGDFAFSRAAGEKPTMEHVHELVLKLYKGLQDIASQIDPDQYGCSFCHFGEQQRIRGYSSDTMDERGSSQSNNSRGSDSSSRMCACCAFGTPLRIGAALCHLYRENPARFSLLLHDSVLLALLPLQPHAAATLADALFQHPSPLMYLLTDGGASQLLKAAAEATAAEVVAAGAGSRCSVSRRVQPHETSANIAPAPEVAFASAAKRYTSLTSSNSVWGQSHSWPKCVRRPRSRDLKESYSCCGVSLCEHKRAAAKRFLERQQQMLQRQMQPRMLQCHMQQQQTVSPLHQVRELHEGQDSASAKDAKADPVRHRRAEVLEGIAEVPPAEAAAKTAASLPAATGITPSGGDPENSTKTTFGCGSAVCQNSSSGCCAACTWTEKQLRLFNSSAEPQLSLGQYVTRLQRLAFTTEHELLMALLLLTHAQQRQQQLRISTKNAHRLLLAALVLVSKVVRDDHTPLALWAVVGGVPPRELASLEMALLELVGHRISFSLPEFAAAYCVARALSHMQQQQQQQQNIIGGRVRSTPEGEEGENPAAIRTEEENVGSGIRASAEPELGNNRNSDPPSPSMTLYSKETNPEETLLPRSFTYAALKTNPILRRFVQLQGIDASLLNTYTNEGAQWGVGGD